MRLYAGTARGFNKIFHTYEDPSGKKESQKSNVNSKKNSTMIAVFNEEGNLVMRGTTQSQVSKELKVHQTSISKCLSGRRLKAEGYYFVETDMPLKQLKKIAKKVIELQTLEGFPQKIQLLHDL